MFTPLPKATSPTVTTSSTATTSSAADPFAEPFPMNLNFPNINENSDLHTTQSEEASGVNKWHSDLDASFSTKQSSGNVESRKRKSNESGYSHRQTVYRLRAHRFPLTRTGYKYLEIGINITRPSKVEIAIGDTRGKEVVLTYMMWKNIIDNEDTIFKYFLQIDEGIISHPIRIDYLTLRFGKINNLPILRMETISTRLALSKDTVSKMINHKFIIKNIYETLNNEVTTIDSKYARFNALIANTKDINSTKIAVCNDSTFNEKNKIDGELYSRLFD